MPVYKIYVQNEVYVLFEHRLDRIKGSRLERAIRGGLKDDKIVVDGTNIYLDTYLEAWRHIYSKLWENPAADVDYFTNTATETPAEKQTGGLGYVDLNTEINRMKQHLDKISSSDEEFYKDHERTLASLQGGATQEEVTEMHLDTATLLSEDPNGVKEFFEKMQHNLSENAFDTIGALSTDSNIKKFIQNMNSNVDETESPAETVDLNLEEE